MRPRRLARLLDAVRPRLAEGAEVSIEANPGTGSRPPGAGRRARDGRDTAVGGRTR